MKPTAEVVAECLEGLCEHPYAACAEARSRNRATSRNHFFDQHQYRECGKPQHVDYAGDEQ
jgi:hypothetical protein